VTDDLVGLFRIEIAGMFLRGCRKNGRVQTMGWKKDRLAGGKLMGCKERGEWAELYFMMLAAGRGMKVSKPFGDSASYDVGAENRRRVLRVQVKSTLYKRRGECYSLNVMGPERKMYAAGTVDFFAILLIPRDDWYILPFQVLGQTNCSLHFSPGSRRHKYRQYREAWELLLREEEITIQACSGEERGESRARPLLWVSDGFARGQDRVRTQRKSLDSAGLPVKTGNPSQLEVAGLA